MKKSTAVIASVLALILPLLAVPSIHTLVAQYPIGAFAVAVVTALATLFHVPVPDQK